MDQIDEVLLRKMKHVTHMVRMSVMAIFVSATSPNITEILPSSSDHWARYW